MRTFLFPVLFLFLASCSAVGLGGPANTLEITDYGIYKNGQLISTTTSIPRELGTTFGFHFKVVQAKDAKDQPVKARIITKTPGLIDPAKNKTQMDYISETTLTPGQTYQVLFTFSEPWELAAGKWELAVETDKGETLSQTFEVYKPKS